MLGTELNLLKREQVPVQGQAQSRRLSIPKSESNTRNFTRFIATSLDRLHIFALHTLKVKYEICTIKHRGDLKAAFVL